MWAPQPGRFARRREPDQRSSRPRSPRAARRDGRRRGEARRAHRPGGLGLVGLGARGRRAGRSRRSRGCSRPPSTPDGLTVDVAFGEAPSRCQVAQPREAPAVRLRPAACCRRSRWPRRPSPRVRGSRSPSTASSWRASRSATGSAATRGGDQRMYFISFLPNALYRMGLLPNLVAILRPARPQPALGALAGGVGRAGRRTCLCGSERGPVDRRGRSGADARNRTADPFITSEVLCQLSYVGLGSSLGILGHLARARKTPVAGSSRAGGGRSGPPVA